MFSAVFKDTNGNIVAQKNLKKIQCNPIIILKLLFVYLIYTIRGLLHHVTLCAYNIGTVQNPFSLRNVIRVSPAEALDVPRTFIRDDQICTPGTLSYTI